jgi:hypothetical protein
MLLFRARAYHSAAFVLEFIIAAQGFASGRRINDPEHVTTVLSFRHGGCSARSWRSATHFAKSTIPRDERFEHMRDERHDVDRGAPSLCV